MLDGWRGSGRVRVLMSPFFGQNCPGKKRAMGASICRCCVRESKDSLRMFEGRVMNNTQPQAKGELIKRRPVRTVPRNFLVAVPNSGGWSCGHLWTSQLLAMREALGPRAPLCFLEVNCDHQLLRSSHLFTQDEDVFYEAHTGGFDLWLSTRLKRASPS